MKINIDVIEYGLKLFHEFKYNNRIYEYTEIPKIVDAVLKIELLVNHIQNVDSIEEENYFKISELLEKYFRTEFIKHIDNKGVNEYLESKSYFQYDDEINWALKRVAKSVEREYYYKWLKKEKQQIERLKEYNRYFKDSENELIKNISIESFNIEKIYLFLKQYFINKLEYFFSNLHLEFQLAEIKIVKNNSIQDKELKNPNKKIASKYYALYHWILIELGSATHFERNENKQYYKSEIIAFAKARYKDISPQMFYREFIGMNITNKTAIANSFGKGYKKKVVSISDNNTKVITHLKKFPN